MPSLSIELSGHHEKWQTLCHRGRVRLRASHARIDSETLEKARSERDSEGARVHEAASTARAEHFLPGNYFKTAGPVLRRRPAGAPPRVRRVFQRLRLFARPRVLLWRFITVRAATSLARRP